MIWYSELTSTISPVLLTAVPVRRSCFHHVAIALFCTLCASFAFAQSSPGDACLPSHAGVRICQPESNIKTGYVVTIIAGAVAESGNIAAIRAYIDNRPVFTVDNSAATNSFQVAQDVNVNAGTHHLVVVGYQDEGGAVVAGTDFNSATATFAPCIPSQPGAEFCHPGTVSAIDSPIQISAGVRAMSGHVTAIRLYVDNEPQLTIFNPHSTQTFAINEPLVIPNSSARKITLVGYGSTGGALTVSHSIPQLEVTAAEACEAPGAPGVNVCSPQAGSCTTNGLYRIRAAGTGPTGPVDHMELWADSVKVADFPGNSIDTNIGPPLLGGDVTLTVVVVDIHGKFLRSGLITVFAC